MEGPRLRGPFFLPIVPATFEDSDMTKSELIERLAARQTHLMQKDVELAVKQILDRISLALAKQDRVEIRGFGSFALHHRPSRIGRNPKTGEPVTIPAKHVPHFKPGKEMRERVNAGAAASSSSSAPGA
jgi:integration host factor subunit beta